MKYKNYLNLLSLCLTLLLASPAQAAVDSTQPIPTTQEERMEQETQSSLSGPLSNLVKEEGIREVKAIDLNALGDKALTLGNKSYESLKKGSVPMFVWSMAASVFIMLLGILFGKRVLASGITGIMVSLMVFAIVHFMPEIALTFKASVQEFLK